MTISLPVVFLALVLAPAPHPQRLDFSLTARSTAPWPTQSSDVSVRDTRPARQLPRTFQPRARGSFRGVRATRVTAFIVGSASARLLAD